MGAFLLNIHMGSYFTVSFHSHNFNEEGGEKGGWDEGGKSSEGSNIPSLLSFSYNMMVTMALLFGMAILLLTYVTILHGNILPSPLMLI